MSNTTRLALAAISLVGSLAVANAQTTQDPALHHPGAPAAAPGAAMPMMDMGKMMSGGMGQMTPMMQMMRGMMSGGMGMAMMPFQHVEGRIAFLRAELAITDAQLPQWNAVADALRAGAKNMQETMAKVMQAGMPTTAPARAEAMVQMMTARLDAMKAMAAGGKALYAVLTDAQKKTADELMMGPMGKM